MREPLVLRGAQTGQAEGPGCTVTIPQTLHFVYRSLSSHSPVMYHADGEALKEPSQWPY